MMLRHTLALILSLAAAAPSQELLAFKAGTLVVAPGRELKDGVLIVRQGRILACGAALPIPAGARVVDLSPATIAPGLVDLWTQAGTGGEVGENALPWTPWLRAGDALDPADRIWGELAAGGITAVATAPEPTQVCGGLACLVKTGPRARVAERSLYLQLSLAAPARQRERPPTSLLGQARWIRTSFAVPLAPPLDKARKGELPVALLADDAFEVAAAAGLARELGLKGFLAGELGHREAPELLEGSGLGAILLPPSPEDPAWRHALPARLAAAGVPLAFASGASPASPLTLRLAPARAVRHGLAREAALAAVTTVPAGLAGVGHCVGSLEPGRDADFMVLDGHPLDPGARLLLTYVDGVPAFTAGGKEEKP